MTISNSPANRGGLFAFQGTRQGVLSDEPKKSQDIPYPGMDQAEQSWRHSLRAAVRRSLNAGLDERWRS